MHQLANHTQAAETEERMTGSAASSSASSTTTSSSPTSSAGTSPSHLGSLASDSPESQGSPNLQARGLMPSGPWPLDIVPCNQGGKGQAWDKTQAEIAEQAKHEAKIEHRISGLRREGLWSLRRLNRVPEPFRPKAQWDYLCEEMQWLSGDFSQERRWKRGVARKVARTVLRFHEDLRQKEERAKREEQVKLRRIAASVAKEVKQFWANVEKVVHFKQQSRLEEKRKKALDLQLDFIVGQTEKYSDLLSQSLTESRPASKHSSSLAGSRTSSPLVSDSAAEDEDFHPQEEEDDEETIEVEEQQSGNDAETRRQEIELLRRESQLPLEEVLRSLPSPLRGVQDGLRIPGPLKEEEHQSRQAAQNARSPNPCLERRPSSEEPDDEEFTADHEEDEDEEDTIEAEEELAGEEDHAAELDELARENELPVADLLRRYHLDRGAAIETPDSDSESSSSEEEEEDSSSVFQESSQSSASEDSTEEEEDSTEEEEDEEEEEEIGMEYLLQDGIRGRDITPCPGPKKEITDIAAAAESLQPKGYTLATAQVKTPVPALLRGTLREYQHIGLDWLVTMYEKRLNGILADEMGLGKTIQTIALLAHLAVEKCNWGPHLIIVPTSVMLNWEMEFKRWCPSFKILTYYGVQKERKLKRQGWTKPNAFHVCITSYKLVLQDHQAFRRKNWRYMILDEAQNIKNFKSQRWQSLLRFNSQRRLLLTGTPLQNSLMELWSLMHFLMPHVFQSHREFKEWFSNPLTGMIEGSQEYNENLVKRLHKVLRPFLLRRVKVDVAKQMPKKYEHVVQCRLSNRQRYLYDDFMSQASTKETLESGHFMSVINILMQLRKVCNHPNLFDPRPTHSPFITQGICYTTASLVLQALSPQPFQQVDLNLFDLINVEGKLSRHEAEEFLPARQVSLKLIEEIADSPEPPPRPRPVRMKVNRMLQSTQKPDGRTVLLVNSTRPPLLVPQSQPQTQGPARTLLTTPTELLHPVQTTAALQAVVSTASQAASVMHGLPPPLPLPQVTGTPRTILAAPRNPVLGSSVQASPSVSLGLRPVSLSALRVSPSPGAPPHTLASYTLPGAAGSPLAQRLILSPDTQARLPTGEVVSIGQLASLTGRQAPTPSQGSKPVTFQIQGNKLTLAGPQLRPMSSGTPRQVQGNVVHLVSSGSPHLLGQPTQLALIQAVSQQNSPTCLQTLPSEPAAPGRLTVPLTATPVPGSVVTSSGVVKIVVRQAPKECLPMPVGPQPRPLAVVSSSGPRLQLAGGTLALGSPSLSPISRPVLRVVQASPMSTAATLQANPTVTRLVVSGPSPGLKEDAELPVLRPVSAPPPAPSQPIGSTSLAAQRPRRHQAPPTTSPYTLEALEQKRLCQRRERLQRIHAANQRHCVPSPIYGTELLQLCDLSGRVPPPRTLAEGERWLGQGYAHCLASQLRRQDWGTEAYWGTSRALDRVLKNPEERIEELASIIDRFIFVIPPVEAPPIQLHVSHPHPSDQQRLVSLRKTLHSRLFPRTSPLHRIICNMRTQFPDLRLIQYDCGKLQVMDPLLRQLKAGGHRVLLFTQMTRMLDILEQFLNFHGHIYLRLDGSTKVEQRQILMDRFNADSRIFCFILSTRSGGVGVNLTGADTVLFYDSDWNPTMDAQAQDRCHRIGQTRDVHIYRLISDRTVEENILKKANQKRMLGDLAIEGGNFTTAFFKEQTIRELFDLPTDTHRETLPTSIPLPTVPPPPRPEEEDSMSAKQTQILEQALCRAEDEEDIRAASLAKAEQVEELAEFNESIPLEGEEGASREEGAELSKAELEIAALVEQLTPIERYAMNYLEASLESISKEELKQAEEQVEAARKDLHQARDESWRWAEPEEDAGEEVSSRRLRRSRLTPQSRSGTRLSQRLRVSRTPEGMDEGGGSLLSYPAQAHDLQIHISPELPEQIFAEEPGVCGGEFPSQGLPIPGSGGQKAEGLGSGGQRADGPGGQRTEGQVSGGHMAECPDMGPVLSLGPGGQRAEGPVSGGASPSLVLGPQGQRAEGPLLVFPGAMGTEGLVEANAMSNGALALEVTTEGQRSEEVLHQVPVAVEGRRSGEVILEMPVTMGVVSRRSVEVVAETPITVDARDERSSELITETTVMDAGSQRSAEVITKSPVNMDAGSQRSSEVVNKAPVTVNAGSQRTAEVVTKTQVTVDIGQRSVEVVAKTPFPKDTGSWRSAEVVAESLVTMDVGGQRSAEVVAETPVIVDAGSWRSAEVVAKVPVTVDAGSRGSAEFVAKTLVTTDAGAQKSEEDISKPLVTTDVGSQGSREGTLETADIVNQKSEIALRTLVATDTESQRSGEGNPRTLVATDTGQRSGAGDLQTSVITDMEVQRLGGEAPVAVRTEGQAGMGRGKRRRRTADRSLLPERGQAEDGAQVSGTVLRKVPGRVNVVVQRREPSAKRRRPGVGRGAVSLPSSDPVPSPPLAKRPHPEEQEEVPAEPPTPRSTRQRPGNLLPPLERRRYKPRGWCVAPKPPPPPPHPKKRGRPPSSASPPGRPPKIRTVTDPPMTPARRGRPPKHPPTDTPPRRGRPPGKGPHGRTLPPPPRPRGRPPSVAARGRGVRRPKS